MVMYAVHSLFSIICIVQFTCFKSNSNWHSNATKCNVGEPFQRIENIIKHQEKIEN